MLKSYLKKISKIANQGDAREESYYATLEELFKKIARSFLTRWDPLTDIYTWREPGKYKETNWYKFQEAVKSNQDTTWDLLDNKVFSKLDLKDL